MGIDVDKQRKSTCKEEKGLDSRQQNTRKLAHLGDENVLSMAHFRLLKSLSFSLRRNLLTENG